MKKSILVLLFLLFLLIVTCVYQKTYTIYSLQNTETLLISETVVSDKKVVKTKKEPIQKPVIHREKTKVPTPSKVKPAPKAVAPTFVHKPSHTEKDMPKVIVKKVISEQKKVNSHIVEEKEVVDYLLSILNERDVALTQRDSVEENLHALIKKALENRRIVIKQMEENARAQEKHTQTLLDARDKASKTVTNERKGK